jgi:hypothetical protein
MLGWIAGRCLVTKLRVHELNLQGRDGFRFVCTVCMGN